MNRAILSCTTECVAKLSNLVSQPKVLAHITNMPWESIEMDYIIMEVDRYITRPTH